MVKYNLVRKRRMKNLRLRVKEDGSVYVSVPYGVSTSVIDEFVRSKESWINEQREKLAQKEVRTELNDGDVITVLGKQCVIAVTDGIGEPFIENNMLVVPLSGGGSLETAVISVMASECRKLCSDAVKEYLSLTGYSGKGISINFKLMKSRWGSYSPRTATITFNLALSKLSPRFISYVAAHEVTHIFVHNHSDEFYKFGEAIFKDFFKTDRELNRIRIGGLFS